MFNRIRYDVIITPSLVVAADFLDSSIRHGAIEALQQRVTNASCSGCGRKPAGENCSSALVVYFPKGGSIIREGFHYVFCSDCAKDPTVKDIKKRVKAILKTRDSCRKKNETA
jgi:hypothetical protein